MIPARKGRGASSISDSSANVKVGMTLGRGRGLFAVRSMTKGHIILVERPLVAMQTLENTQDVMVCRNCLGFVGTVDSQLRLLSGVPRHECLERLNVNGSENCCGNREASPPQAVFSGIHECLQGCGEVYCSPKCRREHFDRCHRLLCVGPIPDEEAPTHPLVAFRVHAMQTNEIFLLVGEVIAHMVSTFQANGGDLDAAMAPFRNFVQEPWWDVAVSRGAHQDAASRLCNNELSTKPESSASVDEPGVSEVKSADDVTNTLVKSCTAEGTASFPETLRSLCEESCKLLREALGGSHPGLDEILCTERIGRVVGMFEQNNVGIRVSSPISHVLRALMDLSPDVSDSRTENVPRGFVEKVAAMVKNLVYDDESDCNSGGDCEEVEDACREKRKEKHACSSLHSSKDCGDACSSMTGEECHDVGHLCEVESFEILREAVAENEGDDDAGPGALFAPLDGTALYTLICCMNHSCRPNCVIQYSDERALSDMLPCTGSSIDSLESASISRAAHPLVAEVLLLEGVEEGVELTQSYVDRSLTLKDRREALMDYGFLCRCPRCLEEEVQSLSAPN